MKRWLIPLLALLAVPLQAETLKTTVSYLSADFLYIQAGASQGVVVGDTGRVVVSGQSRARLVVIRVSDRFAACSLDSGSMEEVSLGSGVALQVASPLKRPAASAESSAGVSSENAGKRRRLPSVARERTAGPRLRGTVGIGVRATDDREPANRDVVEPVLSMRFRLEGVGSPFTRFEMRLRVRRTDRRGWSGAVDRRKWANRVYQVSLIHSNPAERLDWVAGRVLAREVAGLGVMDGALVAWKVDDALRAGAFAGTVPDPVTSEFNSDKTQAGGFVSGDTEWKQHSLQATLAGIGNYHRGTVSREFVYEQVAWSMGRTFMVFHSSELEVNRGWRRARAGSSLALSSFILQARWSPFEGIALETGYDNRRLPSTWETRDTPDSLFDDALRQGWRSSVRWRGPLGSVWVLGGSFRTRAGEGRLGTAYHAGVLFSDLLSSGFNLSLNIRTFQSLYAQGNQPMLTVSRYLGHWMQLHGRVGRSNFKMDIDGERVGYVWAGGGADFDVGQHLYVSSDLEWTRGHGVDANRYSVEAGWRL